MRPLLILVCVLAFLTAGAAALRADGSERPFAVLAEPREADDALPADVLASPTARYDLGDPATARRVGRYRDGTYYVVDGADAGHVCLVRHERDVNVVAMCASDGGEYERAPWFAVYDRHGRRASAALVPDGYTAAVLRFADGTRRPLTLTRNVAFFSTARTARLELRGPDQRTLTSPVPKTKAIRWKD
ncbi:MAG TPA: hypothetical protein VGW75_05025 [Solirubrobacteraceae bacterium]|jgi:hypothetical protein|nr:hypothetical protein [Solirubrobacteraceae bacterium]